MVEFKSLEKKENIYLYAGDLSQTLINDIDNKFIGLSLSQSNSNHIQFDITDPIPLQNNTVDIFCAEDVMEHIEYKFQTNIFNEIHRILKPNGIFRLAVPDYRCDILFERTLKTMKGELKFDPGGGVATARLEEKLLEVGIYGFQIIKM